MDTTAAIITALIAAATNLVTARWAYAKGLKMPCPRYDLTRHPLFERLRYLREVVVPRLDVGHAEKTTCLRKFLSLKLETFEVGMRDWAAKPEAMHSGDVVGLITRLVKEYETKALSAGIPQVFVERFADHHQHVVDATVDALSRIADSDLYSELEKQAAALDILLYAFVFTVRSAEDAISTLNGQLEAALEGRT